MTVRGSIYRKYLALIIALVAGALVVSGAIGIYFSYLETRHSLISLAREKASSAANRIEQFVREIEHQLGWTALPQIVEGADPLDLQRFEFVKLVKLVQPITEAIYINPKGCFQVKSSRLEMERVGECLEDLSKDPRFTGARAGGVYFGPVYFRKETEPYMAIALRAGREGAGVVAVEVNLKFIWEVIQRIRIGEAGLAYVVDKEGHLVAHPDISLVLQKTDLSALPQVKAALQAKPAAPGEAAEERQLLGEARDRSGRAVITAHARIEPLDWYVFVEQPTAEAYKPLYASLARSGALLVAGLLLSILAGLVFAKRMTDPIRALQDGAAAIGAGNLNQKIDVRTGDELQGLAEQFNKMAGDLKESYAGLERKVEKRTAELKETLEQQTAISEILRVTSDSPTDVMPVLEVVARHAAHLCESPDARIFVAEGESLRLVAGAGLAPSIQLGETMPLSRGTVTGRAVIDREPVHVEDLAAVSEEEYPTARELQKRLGHRTTLAVPLLRENRAFGAILLRRMEVRAFSEKQVALVRTFADQAAIAIENVRLFNETKEALEQQTATSEILRVISGSPTDVQPVFDAVVQSGLRLFEGAAVAVALPDGNQVRAAAIGESDPERAAIWKSRFPFPLTRDYMHSAAILDRKLVDIPDASNVKDAWQPGVKNFLESGHRAITIMPMMRGETAIGAISVIRVAPGPLTEKQIALLKTFADQAVIAIENVRLFNETKEALEQQTATGEILQVISGTITDTQPVFQAIVRSCLKLFRGSRVSLSLVRGDRIEFQARATEDGSPTGPDHVPLDRGSGVGRCVLESHLIHIPDMSEVTEEFPVSKGLAYGLGYRSGLFVPLKREGRAIGALSVMRPEPGSFTEKEMALLGTFADQAVIAIENVRLFNETKEALDQQKASADVLGAISSSIADTQPVFETILERCERLFEGHLVGVTLATEDGKIDLAAYHGADYEKLKAIYPLPLSRESGSGSAILDAAVKHYPDIEDASTPAGVREGSRATGMRSIVFAPMLYEGRGIGAIWVGRTTASAFSDKQIALLKTFANQAVIAIQNASLFREIQEKSRQLEIANRHKSEFLANMSHELRTPLNAIIGFSEVLDERYFGELNQKQDEYVKDIHSSGKHLLTLINDILDLSKIEAGRMELDLADFDLPSALQNALTLVKERAQRHGIALGLEVDAGLGTFRADERKFKQIMLNLLSNAVKFTPEGGKVSVAAKPNGTAIEVSVADTGVGIAPEEQAAVFEEFKQVGRDYTRKAEGTGLGLALTRRFVELHGGAITLASAPGRGSTFTFTLPFRHGQ